MNPASQLAEGLPPVSPAALGNGLAGRLRTARESVRKARRLLAAPSPEALDVCSQTLEEAVACLSGLGPGLATEGGDPQLAAEAVALRRDVSRLGELLENAAAFHHGWRRLAFPAGDGYTAGGGTAETVPPPRFSAEG